MSNLVTERPIVVGSRDDEHVRRVAASLLRSDPLIVDIDTLTSSPYRFDETGLAIGADLTSTFSRDSSDVRPRRGWLRRIAPPTWYQGIVIGSRAAAVQTAWLTLLTAFIRSEQVNWLSTFDDISRAENKLLQYNAALNLGIPYPQSVVTSDSKYLTSLKGKRIAVKPLGPGNFVDEDGSARVIYATALSADQHELDSLDEAPFIVQELIPAKQHFRVVTVGEQMWTCGLDADTVPFDWRSRSAAQRSFSAIIPPNDVRVAARQIVSYFHLGFSSQDWILDSAGNLWFLDLNPSGQWLFLPEPVASEVTQEIARWLSMDPA